MVTIVINPKGRDKANFAPVNEFAFFMFQTLSDDVILRAPNGAAEDRRPTESTRMLRRMNPKMGKTWKTTRHRRTTSGSIVTPVGAAEAQNHPPIAKSGGTSSIRSTSTKIGTVVSAGDSIPLGRDPSYAKGWRPPSNLADRH